ncbi:MAG: hypothetical protein AAGE37_00095 [Pseudomonadota bacterium]
MGGTEAIWWAACLLFGVSFLAILLVQQFDPRLIEGVSVWAKPAKFAISTAIHYATLALVVRLLSDSWQYSNLLFWFAAFSVLWAVLEVAYIAIQGGRAMPSHFNVSTSFYATMYSLMAFGAVMVILPAAVVGTLAALDDQSVMSLPLRVAIACGLIGGTVLTLVTAFRLGGNMGPFVGTELLDAARMPITGWSLTVGDLRPAHFLSTHMIQVIPMFGIVAGRYLQVNWAVTAIVIFTLLWTLFTIRIFLIALNGRPFQEIFGLH